MNKLYMIFFCIMTLPCGAMEHNNDNNIPPHSAQNFQSITQRKTPVVPNEKKYDHDDTNAHCPITPPSLAVKYTKMAFFMHYIDKK